MACRLFRSRRAKEKFDCVMDGILPTRLSEECQGPKHVKVGRLYGRSSTICGRRVKRRTVRQACFQKSGIARPKLLLEFDRILFLLSSKSPSHKTIELWPLSEGWSPALSSIPTGLLSSLPLARVCRTSIYIVDILPKRRCHCFWNRLDVNHSLGFFCVGGTMSNHEKSGFM